MQGSCPRRAGDGLRPASAPPWAPFGATVATALLSGCAAPADAGAAVWLWGLGACTITAGLAFAAGWAGAQFRTRQQRDRQTRLQAQAQRHQAELLDGWVFQTDMQHRLQRIHPPAGAPAEAWQRGPRPGGWLWEHFESAVPGDVAGLRARLESQVAFHDLRLRQLTDGSHWRLRAVPRHDDQGRFAGFSGCARPLAEWDQLLHEQAALHALLAALEAPAWLATSEGPDGPWQLRHSNTAAQNWLRAETAGDAPSGAPEPTWSALLNHLPAPWRARLGDVGAGETLDGWRLRRFCAEHGHGLVLMRPGTAGTGSADQAALQEAAAESASFSFTVSHDLRAPIRVVEGFTRILKEDYGPLMDRVGNDHLDRVLSAAARMNHMIDALLALAKLSQQPLARQPVNLSQLAAYVVDELRRNQPDREADIHVEADLLVQGDPTLLRLVLENLLGNAWKYSARTARAQISLRCELHEGRRAFVVRDNGAGFDMRAADRLFGLFQRLHSATDFAGSGVGLASVKRIVRRHGGDIWAEAEPGRGAAFHFTLRD